jgi:hypothetical protein
METYFIMSYDWTQPIEAGLFNTGKTASVCSRYPDLYRLNVLSLYRLMMSLEHLLGYDKYPKKDF